MRPEPADVHVPQVHAGVAVEDPRRHHQPDPARAGDAVRAEPGRDEEPGDLGLAQAELVVGGEPLRPVDHRRHTDVGQHGYPDLRVLDDLGEPVPVGSEQLRVEVGGRGVVGPGGRGVPLVAAHDQAVDLLAVVDEQVRVAQGGQCGAPDPGHRRRHDVLVRHRHHRDPDVDEPRDLGGVHPAAVDDDLAPDVAPVGAHPRDATPVPLVDGVDPDDAGVLRDRHPGRPCGGGQRVAEPRGIDLAVGGGVRGAEHAVRADQREQLARLVGRDQLQRQPGPLCPALLAADLHQPLR